MLHYLQQACMAVLMVVPMALPMGGPRPRAYQVFLLLFDAIPMAVPMDLPFILFTVAASSFRLPSTDSRLPSASVFLPRASCCQWSLTCHAPSLLPSADYSLKLFVLSAQVEPHGLPWGWAASACMPEVTTSGVRSEVAAKARALERQRLWPNS